MSSDHEAASGPVAVEKTRQRPLRFGFDNTYARLPERFYARVNPTRVAKPRLVQLNAELARGLGLDTDALRSAEVVEILAGNRVAEGSEPLAQAYAGHQFGHFVPQLGDGRANLLGEVVGLDGVRYDIQLKGAGPTPFSRRGDGRAALGPVLREYLVSEAMAALGVPTTRALAAVTTGETVVRETVLPGAVLTRVAASHLRVGTFQYFAARGDTEGVRVLADYAIARHYPDARESARPYRALLEGVIVRQARLVAEWMLLGFIHGVMNTDNMSISGETIDYGPCAFMEAYEADKVFSSIDVQGRYAYSNQAHAAHWNLTRLAESLLPLLVEEEGSEEGALDSAREALTAFGVEYEAARDAGLRRKLGLSMWREGDSALAEDLLELMEANRADFTTTFRLLCDAAMGPEGNAKVRPLFADPGFYDVWAVNWRRRLEQESISADERARAMRGANPIFIPRNHLVQAVIEAAVERQDFALFRDLLDVVTRPYEDRSDRVTYATPARPEECVDQTFCGT
ncbi:MAG TPA: YdiU family protein [Acidobacteriaceae bacterium]|nr:YdiU family protein [Acidobacteriaceae bacterium]